MYSKCNTFIHRIPQIAFHSANSLWPRVNTMWGARGGTVTLVHCQPAHTGGHTSPAPHPQASFLHTVDHQTDRYQTESFLYTCPIGCQQGHFLVCKILVNAYASQNPLKPTNGCACVCIRAYTMQWQCVSILMANLPKQNRTPTVGKFF